MTLCEILDVIDPDESIIIEVMVYPTIGWEKEGKTIAYGTQSRLLYGFIREYLSRPVVNVSGTHTDGLHPTIKIQIYGDE